MVDRIITSDVAPPGGHYCHAMRHGDLLYISGQLPVAADGIHRPDATFEEQARQALANLLAIASAGGTGREHLVKVTAYIVDIANWPNFNTVYAEMMGDARPARAIVPVPALHHGYLVEIEAIAAATRGAHDV